MKINLHTDKCIGCGMCTAVAPELFSIDSGVISLKKNTAMYTDAEKKNAYEAAAACPNGVIETIEE